MDTQLVLYIIYGLAIIIGIIVGITLIYSIINATKSKRKIKEIEKKISDFYRNDYWDILIKNYKEFKPFSYYVDDKEDGKYNNICFSWKDRYMIVVWCNNGENTTSMHIYNKPDCVLSSYNEAKSKELANLLIEKWKYTFKAYNVI